MVEVDLRRVDRLQERNDNYQKSVQLHLHLTEEHHSALLVKARQWKVGSPAQHLLVFVIFVSLNRTNILVYHQIFI